MGKKDKTASVSRDRIGGLNRWTLLFAFGIVLIAVCSAWADSLEAVDETLLIFVGEDVEMLSLASRRDESAWEAPAVATVISDKEIRKSGAQNLGQLLETVPGFCMAKKEYGYKPYLRGIQDSILFLNDTVPLGLESDKSYNPLGYGLSLSSVKRVEIIRGPGSVLWGPDAFAGIVNLVPKTGADIEGIETGAIAGGPEEPTGVYLNAGKTFGDWAAFLSVDVKEVQEDDRTYTLSQFWGDGMLPVPPSQRHQADTPDRSRYADMTFRLDHGRDFSVSGRVADSENRYTIADADNETIWPETQKTPSWMLKAEGTRNINGTTSARFSSYATGTTVEHTIIDKSVEHKEDVFFVEGLLDKTCFNNSGLITAGVSYRKTSMSGVPVWEGYLPDYLGDDNTEFLPILSEESVDGELMSVFGQYRYDFGPIDLSAGLRYDDHTSYRGSTSFSLGAVWTPKRDWVFKALVGTAYRTPFLEQLEEGTSLEPERVTSFTLQGIWNFYDASRISLTAFSNRIENHVLKDYFAGAGLSTANKQDISGLEMALQWAPVETLQFISSLTLLWNSGPDETYLYNYYTYIKPDGTVVKYYKELQYGYDPGSTAVAHLTARWTPLERISMYATVGYNSSRDLFLLDDLKTVSFPGTWTVNAGLTVSDVFMDDLDLSINVRNLFDTTDSIPGTYAELENEPRTFTISLRKEW